MRSEKFNGFAARMVGRITLYELTIRMAKTWDVYTYLI